MSSCSCKNYPEQKLYEIKSSFIGTPPIFVVGDLSETWTRNSGGINLNQ